MGLFSRKPKSKTTSMLEGIEKQYKMKADIAAAHARGKKLVRDRVSAAQKGNSSGSGFMGFMSQMGGSAAAHNARRNIPMGFSEVEFGQPRRRAPPRKRRAQKSAPMPYYYPPPPYGYAPVGAARAPPRKRRARRSSSSGGAPDFDRMMGYGRQ